MILIVVLDSLTNKVKSVNIFSFFISIVKYFLRVFLSVCVISKQPSEASEVSKKPDTYFILLGFLIKSAHKLDSRLCNF